MANRLQIPLEGYSNPNFTIPEPGTQPSRGNVQARPDHVFSNGKPPPGTMPGAGPDVTDAEFRNAKPIGGSPQTIKAMDPTGKYYDAARTAGAKVGDTARAVMNNPAVRGAGKALGAVDAAVQGTDAVNSFQAGDNVMGGYHAARAATSIGAAQGNPVAAAAAGGLFVGDRIYNNISEDTQNSLGGAVNRLVNGAGKVFGQEWGMDPAKADAAVYGGSGAATPTNNKPMPMSGQNPLRVQEARAGISSPGQQPVAPENGKFGKMSAPGTFGDGFNDMGGGIAGKSTRPDGKVNSYTNLGADGKPTALSQMDSRTPDQIANGNRIMAEAERNLTNPNGTKWTANDNAIMAANIRDGIDPYRGTSRGASGGGGGGGSGMSASERVLAQAEAQLGFKPGKLASKSLFGQIMGQASQADADAARTDATREGNRLQNQSSMYGHDIAREGHQMTSQNARSRLQYDMGKDQRDFNTTRSDKSIEHGRNAREDALKYVDRFIPLDKDGKPDAAVKGQFLQFASNHIGNQINQLRQSKDPKDHAMADQLAKQDISTLDADQWKFLKSAWDTRAKAEGSKGWFYGSSNSTGSLNPQDWVPNGVDKSGMIDRVNMSGGQIAANRLKNSDGGLFSPLGQNTASHQRVLEEAYRQNPNWNKGQ